MAAGGKWTSAEARAAATAIVRRLHDGGHTAYFAGGCVRDELLGHEPTDYDVATDARPERLTSLFKRTATVGASFGVVLVKERGVAVEVATFRSDGPYTDKRRPDHVEFSDAAHDAGRRDFTINALFLDPLASEDSPSIHGHVIDHVGGMADLEAGVLRAVGNPDARLAEDHLRALRAVRFAARYGLEIEAGTARAIREHASELAGVSRERVGEELRRMLGAPTRARAAELMQGLGLDGPVLLEEPVVNELPRLTRLGDGASFEVGLCAWALDRGLDGSGRAEFVSRVRSSLCLSNEERDLIGTALEALGRLKGGWLGEGLAAQKRLAAGSGFAEGLELLATEDVDLSSAIRSRVAELEASEGGLQPEPIIDGRDLLGAGLSAGPNFSRILSSVYDAQLEGRVKTKAQAMELVRRLCV